VSYRTTTGFIQLITSLCLVSAPALAQTTTTDSSVQIRIAGDVTVPAGEREGAVIVIHGNARIAGHVGAVVVVDGTATIAGGTVRDLIVIRGRASLLDSAVIDGDVHLIDSQLDQAASAHVAGKIERGWSARLARDFVWTATLLGLGVLIAFVLAGVLAASVAPEALHRTSHLIEERTVQVLTATAVVWFALPIAAALLIPTLIGLPIGLGYFAFVLPVLGFLGLIVSGSWLGGWLSARVRGPGSAPVRPTLAAAIGITVLLLLGRVPVLGLVTLAAVLFGAGAVVLAMLRSTTYANVARTAETVPHAQATT
jgi:hypothetical protein